MSNTKDNINLEKNNSMGMSNDTYQNLKNIIAYRESNFNQYAVNSIGYMGKYQFGAEALADTGFVKKENLPSKKQRYSGWQIDFLNNPDNWTIKGGKEEFLSNSIHQEKAMDSLLHKNYSSIKKGIGYTSEEDLSGKLMASHLGGYGNVRNLFKYGVGFKDGYGTDITSYYNLGTKAGSTEETLAFIPKKSQAKMGINTDYQFSENFDNKATIPSFASNKDNSNNSNPLNSLTKFLFGSEGLSGLNDNSLETLALGGSVAFGAVGSFFNSGNSNNSNIGNLQEKALIDDNNNQEIYIESKEQENQEIQNSNLSLFPVIIDKVANSQEQLNTIIKQNPTADNTNILKKHYEINKKIQSIIEDFYDESFDEQNTNISLHNSKKPKNGLLSGVMINQIANSVNSKLSGNGGSSLLSMFNGLSGGALGVIAGLMGKTLLKTIFKPLKFLLNPNIVKFLVNLPKNLFNIINKSVLGLFNKFNIIKGLEFLKKSFSTFKTLIENKIKDIFKFIDDIKLKIKPLIEKVKTPTTKVETPKPKSNLPTATPKSVKKSESFFGKMARNVKDFTQKGTDFVVSGAKTAYDYGKKGVDYVFSGQFSDDVINGVSKGYKYSKDFIAKTADDVANFTKYHWDNAKQGVKLLKDKSTEFISKNVLNYVSNLIPPQSLKILGAIGKKIPGISIVAGLAFATDRILDGDYNGAVIEVLSGLAGTLPGLGTLASVGLDSALIAKDMGMLPDEFNRQYNDLNASLQTAVNSLKTNKTNLDNIKVNDYKQTTETINSEIDRLDKSSSFKIESKQNTINSIKVNSDYIEKSNRELPNLQKIELQPIHIINYANSQSYQNVNTNNVSMNLSDTFNN